MAKRLLFIFIFLSFLAHGQTAQLDTINSISEELTEISGLLKTPNGNIWCLNDSGNKPELFQINESGQVLKKVTIANAKNTDWEDLATDGKGRIFIGDHGNNRNNRKDLRIYIVLEKELLTNDTVNALEMGFRYEDQKQFPPKKAARNFDAEALVYYREHLYIFTKNRTEPFTGYAYAYRLPIATEDQVAERVDSLFLGTGPRELYQLTGADISPDGNLLALLSYDKYFLIHDFPFDDFFGGRIEEVETPLSQKESITFINDSLLLLADERSVLGGGYLYSTSIAANRKANSKVRKYEVTIPNKQFADTLLIQVETELRGKIYYEFFSSEGDRVNYGVVGNFDRGKHEFQLTPPPFMNGTYLLNIQVGKRPHAFFVYRFSGVDWNEVDQEFKNREQEIQNRQTTEPER